MADNARPDKSLASHSAAEVDDDLERWMVAYDEALASGDDPTEVSTQADTLDNQGHRPTAACLDMIERVRRHDSDRSRVSLDSASNANRVVEPNSVPGDDFPIEVGRFEIERELGKGGFGIVFLARDPALDRHVALKIPRPEVLVTPELRSRFLREAKAAGTLNHANIVAIFESGTAGAVAYIASSYCEGPTVADWLKDRVEPVPDRCAAKLIANLSGALQHAHDRGVLHRDLKPANVILDAIGGASTTGDSDDPLSGYIPKIADFGLAKVDGDTEGQTRSHAIIGTPSYMAPEQAAGHARDVGPATDIYGLGTILYQTLTGVPPFRKQTDVATLQAVQIEDPIPPRRIRRAVPTDLDAICLKCLEKRPAQRYASATALADDLNRFLDGLPVQARPITSWQRMMRWAARNRAVAALSGISAVLLITVATVTTIGYWRVNAALRETDRQWRRAEDSADEAMRQSELAEANFHAARDAVDDYLTTISESTLLEEPTLMPLRKQLLEHARTYHQQLAKQSGDNTAGRADLAVSYIRISMISHDLGDTEWLDSTTKSLELFEALIKEGVSLADLPPLRTGLYNTRSSRFDSSNPKKSATVFARAIGVWENLFDQHPDVPGIRSDLAALHFIRGLLCLLENESDSALTHLERSRILREELVADFPDKPIYLYFLAETLTVIGMQYLDTNRAADASPLLKRALSLFQKTLEHYPEAARIEFNLVLARLQFARSLFQTGKPLPAMIQFSNGMKVLEKLVQRYPNSADYQVTLATSYASLAHTLKQAGMQEAAADAEAKTDKQVAVVLNKPLDSPSSGTPVLEMAYLNLGALLRRRGEYREAEMILERFLAVRPKRPEDPFVRDATYHLAMIDRAQGDLESCLTRLGEAINFRRAGTNPLDHILGTWLVYYGDVARELEQMESAQIAYEEALSILTATMGSDHKSVLRLQTRLANLKSQ